MPDPPQALPDALPHHDDRLGPTHGHLAHQRLHALIHLLLAQLAAVPRRPRDDVGVAQPEQPGQLPILRRQAAARRAPAAVQQLPEEVRGVRVGVALERGADPRVQTHEDGDESRLEDVGQGWEMGIEGGRCVGRARLAFLRW